MSCCAVPSARWPFVAGQARSCSGSFLLADAVRAGADAFVTGEMHYHEFFDQEQRIQICVIGHYQSEQFTGEIFREIIERECPGVRCCMTEICTNPIRCW